jgi:hypothetical protein
MLPIFLVWFVGSIFVGIGANGRGRNGLGWFALSAACSPLLTVVLLALLPVRVNGNVPAPTVTAASATAVEAGPDPSTNSKWLFLCIIAAVLVAVLIIVANLDSRTLPTHQQATRAEDPMHFLGALPIDVVSNPQMNEKFRNLLGAKYEQFVENLGVSSPVTSAGPYYVGEGIRPHLGGSDEAAFAIQKDTGHLSAIKMSDSHNFDTFGVAKTSDLPPPLYAWLKQRVGEKAIADASQDAQNQTPRAPGAAEPPPVADPLQKMRDWNRTEAARLLATNPPPFELDTAPVGEGAMQTGFEAIAADTTDGTVQLVGVRSINDVPLSEPLGEASVLTVFSQSVIRLSDGHLVLTDWQAVDCVRGLMWSAIRTKQPDGSTSWGFFAPGLPTLQKFPAAFKERAFVCGHRPRPPSDAEVKPL